MRNFDRIYAVEISPDIRIDGLRVKFNIKKDVKPDNNYCRLEIYNLSPDTRRKVTNESDALVRIQAGYRENVGLVEICQGNISAVSHAVSRPDVITTIHCKDGFAATRTNLISVSYGDGTPLYTIIENLTEELGLPVRFTAYDRNAILQSGFSYLGSIRDCLDLLSTQFDFQWSIQDGQLLILEMDGNTNRQAVLLSPDTGLIAEPEEVVSERDLDEPARGEYDVLSLLQPQLNIGDIVVIQSGALNGNFVVNEINHIGDNRGAEWVSKIRVRQVG